jgi:hypothetical protein
LIIRNDWVAYVKAIPTCDDNEDWRSMILILEAMQNLNIDNLS